MKIGQGKYSGMIGNAALVHGKHGDFFRSRPSRPPRWTPDRQRVRRNLAMIACLWLQSAEEKSRLQGFEEFPAWAGNPSQP